MYRCPNDDCRSRKEFGIKRIGYNCIVVNNDSFQSKEYMQRFGKYKIQPEEALDNIMTCKYCGHKAATKEFINAYKNPMEVFDTANLCDCGGEIWQDFDIVKLDVPEEDYIGDQRPVSKQIRSTPRCEKCGKTGQPTIEA